MKYLLLGNPNVGKSTLFNSLTHSTVNVGNYSGITVEETAKHLKKHSEHILIDLPGTYSVTPSSEDEGLVSKFLLNEHYNGIVNIVDSTHLKRNLHLTVQLLELGCPQLVILNLKDALLSNGYKIDLESIKKKLGVKVLNVSARKFGRYSRNDDKPCNPRGRQHRHRGRRNFDCNCQNELDNESSFQDNNDISCACNERDSVVNSIIDINDRTSLILDYGLDIEEAIIRIVKLLNYDMVHVDQRWLALRILEGDEKIFEVTKISKINKIRAIVKSTEEKIVESKTSLSLKGAIYNIRRGFINDVVNDSLIKVEDASHKKYFKQKIDRILTHPIYGIMIFSLIMFLIYFISFGDSYIGIGVLLTNLADIAMFDYIAVWIDLIITTLGFTGIIHDLLMDGVVEGVFSILIFLPQIIVFFFLISFLEGTGYMARVTIVMDKLLYRFGLNGKSIIPIITGFGCSVPAVMSTRTIVDKRERIVTALTIPFVSCSARIPVYAFFVSVFFAEYKVLVIIFINLLGVLTTLVASKILSKHMYGEYKSEFILELPSYRAPQINTIAKQTWGKAKRFVKKAGTFILIGSIIIWILSNFSFKGYIDDSSESFLAYIAGAVSWIFIPLGFGTWEATSALITGVLAKESIVPALEVLYTVEISTVFNSISALTFIVFCSLYVPCIATLATIKSELKSWKYVAMSAGYSFLIAYIVAFIVMITAKAFVFII